MTGSDKDAEGHDKDDRASPARGMRDAAKPEKTDAAEGGGRQRERLKLPKRALRRIPAARRRGTAAASAMPGLGARLVGRHGLVAICRSSRCGDARRMPAPCRCSCAPDRLSDARAVRMRPVRMPHQHGTPLGDRCGAFPRFQGEAGIERHRGTPADSVLRSTGSRWSSIGSAVSWSWRFEASSGGRPISAWCMVAASA